MIPRFVGERLATGLTMLGANLVRSSRSIARAVDEIAAMAVGGDEEMRNDQIAYLPLR